jgi:hypothetical protein
LQFAAIQKGPQVVDLRAFFIPYLFAGIRLHPVKVVGSVVGCVIPGGFVVPGGGSIQPTGGAELVSDAGGRAQKRKGDRDPERAPDAQFAA